MKSTAARRLPARDRLIAAAAQVFARDGLTGATTRAIAREADVNEVTLFRHFGSKERLLAAVVRQNFGPAASPGPDDAPPPTDDLRADLVAHARRYNDRLTEHLPLIRAMIGEIHHHREQERAVFRNLFQPLRDALVARLDAARAAGALRRDCDPALLSDLIIGMIFTGVLKRAAPHVPKLHSTARYLDAAVDLLLRGAAA